MAGVCAKCKSEVNVSEAVACADCQHVFHPACCSVKTLDALKKIRSKRNFKWSCEACKADSTSSHSRPEAETGEPADVMAYLKDMRKEMKDNMDESRRRFDGLEETLKGVRESIEELRERMLAVEKDNMALKELCDEQAGTISTITTKMRRLQEDLVDIQQYSRRNNIEVKGVPLSQNENVYLILECIAKALNVSFHKEDFSVAHRLRTPEKGHPAIIAAFISRTTRDAWLTAAKGRRLTTADLSTSLPAGPVYVNTHLSGHNKYLLGRAKALVRAGKLFAAWTVEGKVLVRHAERQPAVRIVLDEHLDRLEK